MKKLLYISIAILLSIQGFSQKFTTEEQHYIDSLNAIIKNKHSHDTSLAAAYVGLSEMLAISNYDTVIPLCIKAKNIAEKNLVLKNSKTVNTSLLKSLSAALNNIGFIYEHQGNIKKALAYYLKSLKIDEKIGNKKGVAMGLNNIALIYYYQGDVVKAKEYNKKSLSIREEIGDKNGITMSLNNIGFIYDNENKLDIALDYYLKSLIIAEEINDKYCIASVINNLGVIYNKQALFLIRDNGNLDSISKKTNEALNYFKKSLKIQEDLDDKEGVSNSLLNIGKIYFRKGDINNSRKVTEQSLVKSIELNFPKNINNTAELLSMIYEKEGNGMKALEMYKLHISMRDSITNEDTKKATAQQQAKYEYEKQKVIDDAQHEKQLAIEQEAQAKQKVITYTIAGGLGLVVIFLIFVFNRLQVTKRQKIVIETQKLEVEQQKEVVEKAHLLLEEKNSEIIASIRYAKRIQDALMTSQKYIERNIERLKASPTPPKEGLK